MATLSYNDAIQAIRSGVINPVYLLAGGDPFFEDFLIQEVGQSFLSPGSRKQVFSLDDDQPESVLAELSSYGLFQDHQLLVVRQVQRLAGTAREELLTYVHSPDSLKCLILILEDFQPSKGLQKALGSAVKIVDTRPPFPDKLRSWASYYARLKGFTVQSEALDLLVDLAGDSAGHVVSELEKIFSQLEENATISREMVEDQVGSGKSYQLWELQEAVAQRNMDRSLQVGVSLLEFGTHPTRIVGALAGLFCQLHFLQTGTTAERVFTGLNQMVSRHLRTMGKVFTVEESTRILRMLLDADMRLKSTSVVPSQLVIGLIAGICRGQS